MSVIKIENNLEYLTEDQVRELCPVAFAQAPTNSKVSKHYNFINSATIMQDLKKLGWLPVKAVQRAPKPGVNSVFSKHMIIFEHPEMLIEGENGDNAKVRIVLTNSHDGLQAFRFNLGVFRAVCENGLVFHSKTDPQFAGFKILHKGYTFAELRKNINEVVEDLPKKVEVLNDLYDRSLNEQEKFDFALKGLLIREGISENEGESLFSRESIENLLEPNREFDKGDSLWKVFNTVQENLIKGGKEIAKEGKKPRKLRPIKGFERDLDINKKLFEQVLEFV